MIEKSNLLRSEEMSSLLSFISRNEILDDSRGKKSMVTPLPSSWLTHPCVRLTWSNQFPGRIVKGRGDRFVRLPSLSKTSQKFILCHPDRFTINYRERIISRQWPILELINLVTINTIVAFMNNSIMSSANLLVCIFLQANNINNA